MLLARPLLLQPMKQVHNVRLRLVHTDRQTLADLFSAILGAAMIRPEDATITLQDDGTGELYQGELWLDRQQPVRKFLQLLMQKLSKPELASIAEHPGEHLDTQTHCFLALNKQTLLSGEWRLAANAEAAVVRLNIAAFPATKQNAERIIKQLFNNQD